MEAWQSMTVSSGNAAVGVSMCKEWITKLIKCDFEIKTNKDLEAPLI